MDWTAVIVIMVGAVGAVLACSGLDAKERTYSLAAFAAHVMASFAQAWLQLSYYDGQTDASAYQHDGEAIAKLLDRDFWTVAPEVAKLGLHMESFLPVHLFGEGTGTGTMVVIAGAFEYVAGSSLINLFLLATCVSWFGQVCWYRVAREELPKEDHFAALVGFMFVPSVVFWGACFAKEALVLGGFGLLGLSTYRVLRNGQMLYLLGIGAGGAVVAMIKAYTLLPYILAVSAAFYTFRVSSGGHAMRLRPLYVVLACLVALMGMLAMVRAFPEYGADNIADTLSRQQESWTSTSGGSNIATIGGESVGLTEQLGFVPLALINSFLRPAIFEADSAPLIGAALETTLLAVALIMLLDGRGAVLRLVTSSPLFAGGTTFIFVFAAAVGLTTSNLGSLSRYRVPMLPFYATLLLVAHRRRRAALRSQRPVFNNLPRRRAGLAA